MSSGRSIDTVDSSEISTKRLQNSSAREHPVGSVYAYPSHMSGPPRSVMIKTEKQQRHQAQLPRTRPSAGRPSPGHPSAGHTNVVQYRPVGPQLGISANLEKTMRETCQTWFQKVICDKGVEGLKVEFASLRKTVDPSTISMFLGQPVGTINRYRDVPCLDRTRVVLRNTDNNYIHANFVSTPMHDRRFICTQGPTDSTCSDFWKMVVQERSAVVLMLCNLQEKKRQKCSEYFPSRVGESMTFGSVAVTCIVQKNLELPRECIQKIVIRISGLVVVMNNDRSNPHFCDHYQWIDWPDRSSPPADMTAIHLLNTIRPTRYPIIVHCSAGIGRTGSIVMIEYIIELLFTGKPFDRSDAILSKIRSQRLMLIQTDHQYLFVHRVICEYIYRLNLLTPENATSIKTFVKNYNDAVR